MDKVSIILPVYRVEDYLARALDSLVGQTYENIEIIPVDDCSPDSCREILTRYAQNYEQIKPIYFSQNQGVSAARNAALDAMSGDWVCFCDGDDWYDETYVEKMLGRAKNLDCDLVLCDYYIATDGKPLIKAGSLCADAEVRDKMTEIACGSLSSCTKLIKRDIIERAGIRYPVGVKQSEELPVLPVWAKFSCKIAILDEPLYYYYQRPGGGSASNNAMSDSEKIFCDALALLRLRLGEGYECELECRAIYSLFYGEILKMCKCKAKTGEIKEKIKKYESEWPNYKTNPYMGKFGLFKKTFISFVGARFILGLRVLAKIHSMLIH